MTLLPLSLFFPVSYRKMKIIPSVYVLINDNLPRCKVSSEIFINTESPMVTDKFLLHYNNLFHTAPEIYKNIIRMEHFLTYLF